MNAPAHKGGWNDMAFLPDEGLYPFPWQMYSTSNSKRFHTYLPAISELKDEGTVGLVSRLTPGG